MTTKQTQEKEYKIGNYLVKGTLGRGTFGKVKLGIYLPTHEKVAIKILEKNRIKEKDDEIRVQREFEMLTKFNHLNVILVAEIFESYDAFYTVMEYCEGGELFNYIVKKRKLSEEEASFFYYQIINGLEYIHSLGIVHRDLKPENLLLTKNHILKIIDFGLSNYFDKDKKNLLTTPCGSPCYASPEMVSGKKYNGFRIDVWSTGIILYAMLCGYLPFEDKDNEVLFKKILECKLDLPHHLSLLSKDLLRKILVTNPDKRITIQQIKKHPFFMKGRTLYKQEFSFRYIHKEIKDNNEGSYKPVKTEIEKENKENHKGHDFNVTIPNHEEKNNNIDKLDEEKENKNSVDDKNEVEIKNKKKEKEKEETDLKRENSKNEDRNSNENKENDLNDINIDNKKPKRKNDLNKIKDLNGKNEETIPSIESKIQKSNYTSNNDPESEEFEKILKTEPNNSSHKLKKENKSKNKNKSPSNKSKSKKPINSSTITHTSYNLSNIGNLETNLNSMRIPINTLIKKQNLITSKRKPNITIKNTIINVNMIAPSSIISSLTKKSHSRPYSFKENNHMKTINNNKSSERKKPQLKFYDFNNSVSNKYTETIVKTQENHLINFSRKNDNNQEKHNKFISMKLGEIYKTKLKENNKNMYTIPYKSINTISSRHYKKNNYSKEGKNHFNVKSILPKNKNFNFKDLLLKDILKKFK